MAVSYRIYPKYLDTSTPYHICSKIWTSTIHYPMLCLKIAGWVANSVDPDETPRSAASHLGLYCLLRPVCPNIYGKYGTSFTCWQLLPYHQFEIKTVPGKNNHCTNAVLGFMIKTKSRQGGVCIILFLFLSENIYVHGYSLLEVLEVPHKGASNEYS